MGYGTYMYRTSKKGHKMMMKKLIQLYSKLKIKHFVIKVVEYSFIKLFDKYAEINYSQTGEEKIINYYLGNIQNGFYVEVGANHPIKISNTFNLYIKGWEGICIDPNQNLVKLFKKIRPKDIVVEAAISNIEKEIEFFEFESDEISTIDENHKIEWEKSRKIINTRLIKTRTLNSVLSEFNINAKKIDLLSIDVEGNDFNVLKSIDLNFYRPKLIIVEIHTFHIEGIFSNEIVLYMKSHNYDLVSYATMNAYFVDNFWK